MNLAISTLVIFFLFILPGLLFRRAYYSGVFSKQYFKSAPFQVFVSSIVPGVLFQLSFCYIVLQFIFIDFGVVLNLLNPDLDYFRFEIDILQRNLLSILLYQGGLFLYVFVFAKACKTVVRRFKLDRKFKELRFQNRWHYILSGEVLDFPENDGKGRAKDIFLTYIDIAINTGYKTILYIGFLADYHLTKEGVGLDYIHLRKVKRRDIDKISGKSFDGKEYTIPGDVFLIPFSNVINLNISYLGRETIM